MRTSKCRCGPVVRPVLPTADRFAALDHTAGLDAHPRQAGIAGGQAIAMVNADHVAEIALIGRGKHHPVGGCDHRRAGFGIEGYSLVHRPLAESGVAAMTERRAEQSLPDQRSSVSGVP